ncbi:hypothetical protein TNCT_115341, partial [Trichonephila clavata]
RDKKTEEKQLGNKETLEVPSKRKEMVLWKTAGEFFQPNGSLNHS